MKRKLHFKSLLLLAVMLLGAGSAWAEDVTSTLSFTDKCNGSGTADDGTVWAVTSDGKESNFDNNKGIHYGTSSAAVQYIKLSTSDITEKISKIVVNASTANGVSATVDVTVGGKAFGGDAQSLTSTATDYTFKGSATGEIVVTVTKPSSATKALYVKSIAVTYGEGGSDAPTCEAPTFSIESGSYASTQSVEISTTTDGATIYYTLDGTDPTDNSTEYNGAIEVSDDATIKAIAYLGSVKSSISEITITIGTEVTFALNDKEAIKALGIELPEAGQGTKVESIEKDGISIAATTAAGKTDTRIYQGSDGNAGKYDFRIYTDGTLTFTTGSKYIKKIEFTGNNLGRLSGDNYDKGTWEGSAQSVTLTATGTTTIYTITVTCGNPPAIEAPVSSIPTGTYYEAQSVELSCATDGAEIYYTTDGTEPSTESTKYSGAIEVNETTTIKAIAVTSEGTSTMMTATLTIVPPVEITLTKDMETYCCATAFDLSETGLKAYTAKVVDGVVVLSPVESGKIPAERGVILMGEPGSYQAKALESADKLDEDNELYGRKTEGMVSYSYNEWFCYILQDGVFKKATGDKIKGGKAYLRTKYDVTAAGARELKMVIEGEATGIKAVETTDGQTVYDLLGRKVAAPTKGLYIVNGKKMIVK